MVPGGTLGADRMKITVSFTNDEEIKMLRKLLSPVIKKYKVIKKEKRSIAYIETK